MKLLICFQKGNKYVCSNLVVLSKFKNWFWKKIPLIWEFCCKTWRISFNCCLRIFCWLSNIKLALAKIEVRSDFLFFLVIRLIAKLFSCKKKFKSCMFFGEMLCMKIKIEVFSLTKVFFTGATIIVLFCFLRNYLSTSPKTISCVPIKATISANKWFWDIMFNPWRCKNPGALILQR